MSQDLNLLEENSTSPDENIEPTKTLEVEEKLESLSGALIEMQFGLILPAD